MWTGKLAKAAVLKAICSGFEETTEPAVCLSDGKVSVNCLLLHYKLYDFWIASLVCVSDVNLFHFMPDIETNECLDNNGGCWQDKSANVTACKVLMMSVGKFSCLPLTCGKFPIFCILLLWLNIFFLYCSRFPLFFRTHFVEEYVNALLWMGCSLKEMATLHAKVKAGSKLFHVTFGILLDVEVFLVPWSLTVIPTHYFVCGWCKFLVFYLLIFNNKTDSLDLLILNGKVFSTKLYFWQILSNSFLIHWLEWNSSMKTWPLFSFCFILPPMYEIWACKCSYYFWPNIPPLGASSLVGVDSF